MPHVPNIRNSPGFKDRQLMHVLVGRDLVCWCAPPPYHSDVLLWLANE